MEKLSKLLMNKNVLIVVGLGSESKQEGDLEFLLEGLENSSGFVRTNSIKCLPRPQTIP
jgi:hypothetical protein